MMRIDKMLDQIGQSRLVTALDLINGYGQVPVEPADKEKEHSILKLH